MNYENVFAKALMDMANYTKGINDEFTNGVSSGFRSLDRYLGGLKGGSFTVIAGRSAVGKTSLAISMAVNMTFGENPISVLFYSFEHSRKSIVERVMAGKGGIDISRLEKGSLTSEEDASFKETNDLLFSRRYGFYLTDDASLNLYDLCCSIKTITQSHPTEIVFIDGINLIRNEKHDLPEFAWMTEVSREIKLLARELDIPIVCSCYINREGGKERAPMLADLRDCGLIEHFADNILLIDNSTIRQLYNSLPRTDDGTELQVDLNLRKIIVAKNQNGFTGAFNMKFNPSRCCFTEAK